MTSIDRTAYAEGCWDQETVNVPHTYTRTASPGYKDCPTAGCYRLIRASEDVCEGCRSLCCDCCETTEDLVWMTCFFNSLDQMVIDYVGTERLEGTRRSCRACIRHDEPCWHRAAR